MVNLHPDTGEDDKKIPLTTHEGEAHVINNLTNARVRTSLDAYYKEKPTPYSRIDRGDYFKIGDYYVSKENLNEPTLPKGEIEINPEEVSLEKPQVWSKEIDGKTLWYYNLEGARKEVEYRGEYLPTIEELLNMFGSLCGTPAEKGALLGLPLSGYYDRGEFRGHGRRANIWSDSVLGNGSTSRGECIGISHKDYWVGHGIARCTHGMPVRSFLIKQVVHDAMNEKIRMSQDPSGEKPINKIKPTLSSVIDRGEYFEVDRFRVSKENLGKPTLPAGEIEINPRKNSLEKPQAWRYRIDGKPTWLYNWVGAMKEAEYRGEYLPTIEELMQMLKSVSKSTDEIVTVLEIPFAGFFDIDLKGRFGDKANARLWSSSINRGSTSVGFAYLDSGGYSKENYAYVQRSYGFSVRTFRK